ncbi:MAG: hypothetical protein JST18_03725 [Bacteroidetes bacterium]|nr:hypothetical protein [Bacteroidota bacterium]
MRKLPNQIFKQQNFFEVSERNKQAAGQSGKEIHLMLRKFFALVGVPSARAVVGVCSPTTEAQAISQSEN